MLHAIPPAATSTKSVLAISAVAMALLAGCIVSDQLTTITIHPDGSADWVKFQSNIHSTEKGAKAAQELKKLVDDFDARKDADSLRIVEAGGKILDGYWVRSTEPYANLMTARFPTATALEKFCTIKGERGEVLAQARFTQDGSRRKLSLVIPVPHEEKIEATATPTFKDLRDQQASAISETRVAVAGGKIIASRGFVVAADKRSCLLDTVQIDDLLRDRTEQLELFVEWEVDQTDLASR